MRQDESKLSIIVPAYNVEKYIKKCIYSVVGQNLHNYEIIIVDDGSIDGTSILCDELAYEEKNVRVVHQRNAGTSAARNRGLKEAIGRYIMFLDADDYICEDFSLNSALSKIVSEEADLLVFDIVKEQDIEKIKKTTDKTIEFYKMSREEVIKNDYINMSACGKIIDKKLFENYDINFLESSSVEDMDWTIRLISVCKKYLVTDQVGYIYSDNPSSKTHRRSENVVNDIEKEIEVSVSKIIQDDSYSSMLCICSQIYVIYLINMAGLPYLVIKKHMEFARTYYYLLSYSKRQRERIIYFFSKMIGIRGVITGLKIVIYLRNIKNRIR